MQHRYFSTACPNCDVLTAVPRINGSYSGSRSEVEENDLPLSQPLPRNARPSRRPSAPPPSPFREACKHAAHMNCGGTTPANIAMPPLFLPPIPITRQPTLSALNLRRYLHPRPRPRHAQKSPHRRPTCSQPTPTRTYTPYDLISFRRSRFTAHLNEQHYRTGRPPRDAPSRLQQCLIRAGHAHERRVTAHLVSLLSTAGHAAPLRTIPPRHPRRHALTAAAMRACAPLIRGAALSDGTLSGVADLLLLARLDPFATAAQRAAAHPEAYIVCEAKLSSAYSADHALQAAAYAHLVAHMQSAHRVVQPPRAYLFLGEHDASPLRLDTRGLRVLLRKTRADFERFAAAFDPEAPPPPLEPPVERMAPWTGVAKARLEGDDSLYLIAGIRRTQVRQIVAHTSKQTLTAFAEMPVEELRCVMHERDWGPAYHALHAQARMQLQTQRNGGSPTAFELTERGRGGGALPPPSQEDIYFDMEGFPLMPKGGLEYLFGFDHAVGEFRYWWAHERDDEEKAFVAVVKWLQALVKTEIDSERARPHVFHYGHYEVAALQRIGRRASTAEGVGAARVLETLIQDGTFVDVHVVVTSSMVIGEPSYSIKKVENLVGVDREGDELADAESSVGMYYEWRRTSYAEQQAEFGEGNTTAHPILEEILNYNRQDCLSLRKVVRWLRQVLPESEMPVCSDVSSGSADSDTEQENGNSALVGPEVVAGACGPTSAAKIADSDAIRRGSELSQALLEDGTILSSDIRTYLSQLLHFYVRESLPSRAKFSDRVKKAAGPDYANLFDDDQCLTGVRLVRTEPSSTTSKKFVHTYTFSRRQPSMLRSGCSVAFVVPKKSVDLNSAEKGNEICSFMMIKDLHRDPSSGAPAVTVSGRSKIVPFQAPHFGVLVSSEDLKICDSPLRKSILRTAEKFLEDPESPSISLASSFLSRREIINEPFQEEIAGYFSNPTCRAERLASFLASRSQSCAFVVQGPPGSGKTFLSGNVIAELVTTHGKTVAVSSNSHAAIDNLLASAVRAGVSKEHVWKVGTRCTKTEVTNFKPNLRDLKVFPVRNTDAAEYSSPKQMLSPLVGATCYQLSREDAQRKFDFLFVDEASQVTMANFLSMSPCANYAVLAGDQQQLEMPIRGAHPDSLEVSCLTHIVGHETATVSRSHGIFLETSYRMAPKICQFISDSFYESELSSASSCESNRVHTRGATTAWSLIADHESGIVFVPCEEHPENASCFATETSYGKWYRPAEVAVIVRLVKDLLGLTYTVKGKSGILGVSDIVVVAPFNAQVRALTDSLPEGMRVGTVDKFQGQEAPVAIVSTCASQLSEIAEETQSLDEWQTHASLEAGGSPSKGEQRGLRFALRKNRLNVAISRAQCLAIVTGEPEALSGLPLDKLEDIETAGLYEQIVSTGNEIEQLVSDLKIKHVLGKP